MTLSIVWYVYDQARMGPARFFASRDSATAYRIARMANTGAACAIRWCHRDSVPAGEVIH